ncbi:efflux RND transporter periplasmic adaptor subunit [Limimaricola hongkongensis]|uniref:Efflux transporter, RND family, MFP subunit n=1 Tax=Limimaricola hongkongensis DSM 17492 TaxID=1122180 RepID=A0A017H8U6_9RHOB|nr:HlyD family efflux transporter periplasmic adaptor subunit [Limimaricola hongkongensis]EYD70917.1 efflux transporter, RND family, MFP subunit [Limimaricola hongkongensis DSM 17492]
MRFLQRGLAGLFLMALTAALLGQAGRQLYLAVTDAMSSEPRGFTREERAQIVETLPFLPREVVPVMTAYGELRAVRRLALRAPLGGIVAETGATMIEGGAVAAGETLLVIDPVEPQAALERAEADLSEAEAAERDAARALDLARDTLAQAKAQAALREAALTRQRDLESRGIATASDLETAGLAASSAASAVLSAREAVRAAEARIDQTATARRRASIARDEARRLRDSTVLQAPFDGVLAGVSAREGARVTANEQVAELIDPARLELALRLSTTQYARLAAGDDSPVGAPLSVMLDTGPGTLRVPGRIVREGAAVAEGQTGRLLFARLDAAPQLRPGDFVTVEIEEPPLTGVARLPATALGADGTVLVLREGQLRAVPVALLRRQGHEVLLRAEGLDGAEVVATRTPLLGDGVKARSASDAPDAAPPAGRDGAQASGRGAAETRETEEMIALDAARRARLRSFLRDDAALPEARRAALLDQIEAERVPAALVARLEQRMGG